TRPPEPAGPISRQLMLPKGGPGLGVGEGEGVVTAFAGAGAGGCGEAVGSTATNTDISSTCENNSNEKPSSSKP
ncbi:MAG: hypothetical protein WBE35_06405, partial [Candidatus Cybelea sp.]